MATIESLFLDLLHGEARRSYEDMKAANNDKAKLTFSTDPKTQDRMMHQIADAAAVSHISAALNQLFTDAFSDEFCRKYGTTPAEASKGLGDALMGSLSVASLTDELRGMAMPGDNKGIN